MNKPIDAEDHIAKRAGEDPDFRERLLSKPKATIEQEFGVTLAEDHEIHVHEETDASTHLVLPPRSKQSDEERDAARTGVASLEFLKKTMYDPAPPIRPAGANPADARLSSLAVGISSHPRSMKTEPGTASGST